MLLRQLPIDMLKRPFNWHYGPKCAGEMIDSRYKKSAVTLLPVDTPAGPNEYVLVAEAAGVTIGKPENFPSFGWDNEYGSVTQR